MNTQAALRSRKAFKAKALPVTFLFLVWPFALLLTSLRNFNAPGAKKGFILFCAYFGFVFVISKDLGGADSARYGQMLHDLHQQTPSFENLWASLYSYETNLLDIYQPIVTWFVAVFTDNAHFLFSIFATVFGWFYANNIWIILNKVKGNLSPLIVFFIVIFSLTIPLWNINGVRMWTAAQIFIYGVLTYFIGPKKTRGLLWAGASILVHFSFLFPLMLLGLYKFLPKRLIVFFLFYLITLIFSEINLFTIQGYLRLLPEIFQPRVESYTNIEYAENIAMNKSDMNWYVGFSANAFKIAINALLIIVLYTSRKFLKNNKILYGYAAFILFFSGWANLLTSLPSGGRFIAVSSALVVAFLILFFLNYKPSGLLKVTQILSLPLLIIYFIFSIRVGFDYMGISTFIGNPFSALLIEDTKPIIDFVKSFL